MDKDLLSRINNAFNFDKMYNEVKRLIVVAWNSAISIAQVDTWLNNFTGDYLGDSQAEKALAINVLLNFTYYSKDEIKHLCKVIFDMYIHTKISEYINSNTYLELSDSQKEARIINNTKFISLGMPSESGALVLYWFREANSLPKFVFQINDKIPENFVIIDDVSLSGSQAVRYLDDIENNNDRHVYFLCFFCSEEAEKKIHEKHPNITIISASKIYDNCKAFSNNSVYFNKETVDFKEITKELFSHYGEKVVKGYPTPEDAYMEKYPLGYGDSQQLFGFFYNTPNNTLPLIWISNAGWKPLFIREEKNYSSKVEEKKDEKFL